MSLSARVNSLEALRDFKAGLCKFADEAAAALSSAQMELNRTFEWLDEQCKFWQAERRHCEQKIAQAQADLRRKRMSGVSDRPPDCTNEEMMLRRAKDRLREAEEKLKASHRWKPNWQKAADQFGGPARRLRFMLEAEVPQTIAILDGKIDALDKYVQLAAPTSPSKPGA